MSATTPLTPEQVRYQQLHYGEDRGPVVMAVDAALVVLAVVMVGLRLLARRTTKAALMADDYSIIIAVIFVIGLFACEIIAIRHGLGRHEWALQRPTVLVYIKATLSEQSLYSLAAAVTRLSILLLYRRVFITSRFRMAVNILIVYVSMLGIVSFLLPTLRCIPVNYNWNKTIKGHCVNPDIMFKTLSSFSVITDVVMLILPLPIVWRLQISKRRKFALTGIFMMGGLACVTAVVRLYLFVQLGNHHNPDGTWIDVPLDTWTNAEPCIGIYCACLPVMGPLFRKLYRGEFSNRGSQSASGHLPSPWRSHGTAIASGTGKPAPFSKLDASSESRQAFRPFHPYDRAHTNDVRGGDATSEEHDESWPMEGIQVKSDVEWSTAERH